MVIQKTIFFTRVENKHKKLLFIVKKKSTSLNIYKEFLKSSTPFFLSMMQFDNYINNINLNIFCHKFCFEDIRDTNIFICCNNDAICKITILVKTMLNVLL